MAKEGKENLVKPNYKTLMDNIGKILERGRKQAFIAVNNILVNTYWEIGRQIVEFEQKGNEKAEYGSSLLSRLSKDLKFKHGEGFSKSNIYLMRLFYLRYRKFQTVSGKLTWSHYMELVNIDEDLERSFYEQQCIKESWSVRELRRQINSALFYRIALSKDKKGVLELSKKGQIIERAEDLIKEPYILEFLNITQDYSCSEKELEQKIIDNLQMFLLEFGRGLTFVARQYRISFGNRHFYVDLVFYHRILKCFVLVDLKIGEVNHLAIGQMNLYLNYFKAEENSDGDKEPIGIILGADKNEVLVKFALGSISNKLFVSKYRLYLPDKKQLQERVKRLTRKLIN